MAKRKAYKPRPIRIPMTGLRDTIALHMHASLRVIERRPDLDSFDSLAGIFNMVGITIQHDSRFTHEYRLIQGGAKALNDTARLIESGVKLQEYHLAPIRVGVTAIDQVLGQLDVAKLYTAEKIAVAAVREMRNSA